MRPSSLRIVAWMGAGLLGAGVLRAEPELVVAVGAPGAAQYESNFLSQAQAWAKAAEAGGIQSVHVGYGADPANSDAARLPELLAARARTGPDPLWLVLVGHGTYDGKEARFNFLGPDLTATDLAAWLQPFERPLVIIMASSASAPFLNVLSGSNRVVVTATRSGFEQNATRFGGFLAEAWSDAEADLDQDGQVSLLEAFVVAGNRVAEFYRNEGRLATEHALLDDNGDRLGTPADWFRGVRPVRQPSGGGVADGLRAHQLCLVPSEAERRLSPEVRARRDALELEIDRLRRTKESTSDAEYYAALERLLVELAELLNEPDQP